MKKIFALLSVMILLFSVSASAFTGSGSGTPADPYQITTNNQFKEIKTCSNCSYVLNNDIHDLYLNLDNGDMGMCNFAWDSYDKFRGTFDGQGHTIYNLTIVSNGCVTPALFPEIYGGAAVVENLNVVGINNEVNGFSNNGCIVGTAQYSNDALAPFGNPSMINLHCQATISYGATPSPTVGRTVVDGTYALPIIENISANVITDYTPDQNGYWGSAPIGSPEYYPLQNTPNYYIKTTYNGTVIPPFAGYQSFQGDTMPAVANGWFCDENWAASYTEELCPNNITKTITKTYTDSNLCGTTLNLPADNGSTTGTCNPNSGGGNVRNGAVAQGNIPSDSRAANVTSTLVSEPKSGLSKNAQVLLLLAVGGIAIYYLFLKPKKGSRRR